MGLNIYYKRKLLAIAFPKCYFSFLQLQKSNNFFRFFKMKSILQSSWRYSNQYFSRYSRNLYTLWNLFTTNIVFHVPFNICRFMELFIYTRLYSWFSMDLNIVLSMANQLWSTKDYVYSSLENFRIKEFQVVLAV